MPLTRALQRLSRKQEAQEGRGTPLPLLPGGLLSSPALSLLSSAAFALTAILIIAGIGEAQTGGQGASDELTQASLRYFEEPTHRRTFSVMSGISAATLVFSLFISTAVWKPCSAHSRKDVAAAVLCHVAYVMCVTYASLDHGAVHLHGRNGRNFDTALRLAMQIISKSNLIYMLFSILRSSWLSRLVAWLLTVCMEAMYAMSVCLASDEYRAPLAAFLSISVAILCYMIFAAWRSSSPIQLQLNSDSPVHLGTIGVLALVITSLVLRLPGWYIAQTETFFAVSHASLDALMLATAAIFTWDPVPSTSPGNGGEGIKTQMLRYVCHEMRIPLNAIVLATQDILLSEAPMAWSEVKDHLRVINSGGCSLANLLDDILSLEKVEAGRMKLETTETNIRQLLSESVAMFRGAAEQKDAAFTVTVEKGCPEAMHADPNRTRQILANLMSNAVKFSPESSRISIRASTENPNMVRLSVTDEGPGLSQEDVAQLFKPFTQINPAQMQHGQGTGLGLVISKHLAEMQGGRMEVNSTPGGGATFSFTVPVSASALTCQTMVDMGSMDASPEEVEMAIEEGSVTTVNPAGPWTPQGTHCMHSIDDSPLPAMASSVPTIAASRLRVMVVDDAPTNRHLMARILKRTGASDVDTAGSGVEILAMELGRLLSYDMWFVDKHMPEMSGLELSSRLRHLGITAPIVCVTGDILSEDTAAAGIDHNLSKPVSPEALRKLLLQYTKRDI